MTTEVSKPELLSKPVGRRSLLRSGAAIAATVTLPNLMARQAKAMGPIASPYGAPVPTADQNTGLKLISLPPGFKYGHLAGPETP
jgi:hypothetical protein